MECKVYLPHRRTDSDFPSSSLQTQSLTERLETQIILADTQVSIAILTFLQQDITGYVKGGWTLRKAWKVYQHTYQQILGLYKRAFKHNQHAPGKHELTPARAPREQISFIFLGYQDDG